MTYKLKVRRKGSYFVAILKANIGKDAAITVRAKVAIQAVADILKETYSGRVGEVGAGFLSRIWQSAKTVAKKAAQNKVLKSAYRLLRHPDLTKISRIISSNILFPAIRSIETTLRAARYYRVIEQQPKSDKARIAARKLREAVAVANQLKSAGNPKGITLANALKAGKAISIPRISITQKPELLYQ
jgi:uncharacterized protein YdbL (DUF1318 family)